MAVLTIGNPPTTALYNTGNVRKAGVNKEAAALAATTPLTIAGWGNVSGRGGRTLSPTLRQVASRTTDWAACRADADRNAGSLPANAEDLLVCASSAGATSTCAGDSGSPLFLRSRGAGSDRPTVKVVGVMSFGYGSPLDAWGGGGGSAPREVGREWGGGRGGGGGEGGRPQLAHSRPLRKTSAYGLPRGGDGAPVEDLMTWGRKTRDQSRAPRPPAGQPTIYPSDSNRRPQEMILRK